jgi:hypothetical protein
MEVFDEDDEEKFLRYADAYRKRIESKIDEPLVFENGESCPPPPGLRSIRAVNLWRKATGSEAPPVWGVEDIVLALVIRAFGEPVEPVEPVENNGGSK